MSQARAAYLASINNQILQAQQIAYANASTIKLGGYAGLTRPVPRGKQTKQVQPHLKPITATLLPDPGQTPVPPPPPPIAPPPPNTPVTGGPYGPYGGSGQAPPPPIPTETETEQNGFEPYPLFSGLRQIGRGLRMFGGNANRSLGKIPTPGGIWTPFFILLFMFFAMIPINGYTRFQWFWLVFLGHATLSLSNQTVKQSTQQTQTQTQTTSTGTTLMPLTSYVASIHTNYGE